MSRFRVLWVTALSCLIPTLVSADELLEQRVEIPDGGSLRVELDRGDVEVVTHEDADVRIEARARGIGASSVHFDLRSERGDLVLVGRTDPWVGWIRGGPRVTVRLWVPAEFLVDESPLDENGPADPSDVRTQIAF